MENQTKQSEPNQAKISKKSSKILELEKQVALGLWIQFIGQIIEMNGLAGLLEIETDANTTGEKQILTGVFIRTIGQLMEAISVTIQIKESDKNNLIEEQKVAIAGDFLAALGSALEGIGGLEVLSEEPYISLLVP